MYVKAAIKKVYYENNTIKHTGGGVFYRGNILSSIWLLLLKKILTVATVYKLALIE